MTGPRRAPLTIVLATGQHAAGQQPPRASCTAPLCGRPAVDWLLDTVVALRPAAVKIAGRESMAVRDRAQARPALRRVMACPGGQPPGHAAPASPDSARTGVTVVLSCLHPLLRPAGIRQAVRELARAASQAPTGDSSPRAVLIQSRGLARWWSDTPTVVTIGVVYAGDVGHCPQWLARLDPPNALRTRLRGDGPRVIRIDAEPVESLRGDDPVDRQLAEAALYQRIAAGWQRRGVIIDDPATTRIDATVRIGHGARIRPHTELAGRTVIGARTSIGPVTTLLDTRTGDDCKIRYTVCEQVTIGDSASIGPFAWLRSGTRVGSRTRAGSFVELADSVLGDDSKIPHVSGVCGADIGSGCNIAGFFGTANFDGKTKHRIKIGDHVSIGAANILVGPLEIGDGAYTAAGSTLIRNVPSGALGVARARQTNYDDWVTGMRPGTAEAAAAQLTAQPRSPRTPRIDTAQNP